ncbi:protein KRBA1-like isoform X11 [Mauremys reevesii]|uniref:protein KRBA1-like isoform X11 n=1 Tax=Mauremys reevesii TaxID=260615 RepID=UPI00193F9ADE|nr:protein KRBA1-like isoform X11 [Mauremys reevesii]
MTSGCSAHGASPVPAWAPHAPAPPGCAQPPGAAETAPRERRAAAAPARAPGEAGGEMSAGVAAAQVPVTFEDVAVRFSAEEWQILEGWQKELHKEVMEENYQLLISLGQPVPTLALLALVAEREAAGGQICGISGERERELASDSGSSEGVELAFPEDDPDVGGFWDSGQTEEDGCPTGDEEGARQGSLHLSALMKLVKEIPEFLLGNSKATVEPAEAADSDAEMGSERAFADVKPEVTPETPPPLGLENCLGEVSVNRPSHPDTPSSCVSTSSTEGASLRRLYAEVAPENSPLQGLLNCLKEIPIHRPRYPNMQSPGAPGDVEHKRVRGEVKSLCAAVKTEVTTESSPIQGLTPLAVKRPSYPSTPTSSSSTSSAQGDVEDRRLELGLWRCSHEAGTAENSPLQGLLNCLKEIIVHKPRHPHPSPCKSAKGSTRGDPGQRRLEGEDGSSSVGVKTEVTAEDPQDPGWESCPPARPVRKASPPATPSSRAPRSRAEGEAGGRSLFGEGAVKREGAAESSPAQGLLSCWGDVTSPCPPAWPACSSSTSSAHRGAEQRGLEPGPWRSPGEEAALEDSPLRGLENCLKDIAMTSPRCSHPPASRGAQRALGERPGRGAGSRSAEEAATEDSPLRGLLSCVTGMAVPSPQHPSLPTCSASASGTERETETGGVEAGLWNSSAAEMTPRTSLLHDLANCLQETPVSTSWASRVLAHNAGADVSPRRPAMGMVRSWCGEDISTETSPLRGLENCLRDIPVNSPHMPASSALASPTQRDMGQRRPGAGARRSLGEDVSAENSPLRGLENCLKDIPVPCRSQSNTPGSRSSLSSSPAPRGRLETAGWPVKTEAGAVSEVTPPLQGLENCLKDIAMARPRGSSATSSFCTSKAPGEGEQRPVPRPWGACAAAASAESSPLYGWLNGLKEIPAGRPRYASVPSGYSSSSSADGERAPWGAGPGAWRWGSEELSPENSPLRGLEKCLQEISAPRPRTPSAPAPAAVVGSRQGEMGHWDWHGAEVLPADAPRYGPATCPQETHGTGPGRSSTPSGTSPARDAPGHRHPRRPGTWVKRPHTEARTDAARPPSTGSCTSSEDGGQKADAEWEEFPKRHCSSAAPSPWACCGWESGMPLDLRVERSAIEVVLSEKLDRVSQDFAAMCRDVSSMQSRVAQLERDSRGWTLELAALQKGNKCLSETIRRLESRCHVLENRARRNSLRLVGLPEGAEGGDPVAFLQRTLPTMLNLPADWPPLEIESARRVHGGARWDPATRPQALLFRLLRFSDKLAIMRAVRKRAEPLTCGGARVALFPDVCPKLCRRRAARHAAVRRPWRAAELRLGTQPSGCCHGRARGHGEPLPSPPGRAPAADEQGSRVTKGQ